MTPQELLKEIEVALEQNKQSALEYANPSFGRDFGECDPVEQRFRTQASQSIANQRLKHLSADGPTWTALLEYVRTLEGRNEQLETSERLYQFLVPSLEARAEQGEELKKRVRELQLSISLLEGVEDLLVEAERERDAALEAKDILDGLAERYCKEQIVALEQVQELEARNERLEAVYEAAKPVAAQWVWSSKAMHPNYMSGVWYREHTQIYQAVCKALLPGEVLKPRGIVEGLD